MSATEASRAMRSGDGSYLAEIGRWPTWSGWALVMLAFLPLWLGVFALEWLFSDWRLAVEEAAGFVGSHLGFALFSGLWCLLLLMCRTVRTRSAGVRASVEGSSASESDWVGPFGERAGRVERETPPLWVGIALALVFVCFWVAVALVGMGAPVAFAATVFELFWLWFGVASLAGAFLWIRFVVVALRSRSGARQVTEASGESAPPKILTRLFASAGDARAWIWSAMACPPLLAALVFAGSVTGLGVDPSAVELGLVSAVKGVLFAAAILGLYRGGRFLWRSGEVLG